MLLLLTCLHHRAGSTIKQASELRQKLKPMTDSKVVQVRSLKWPLGRARWEHVAVMRFRRYKLSGGVLIMKPRRDIGLHSSVGRLP